MARPSYILGFAVMIFLVSGQNYSGYRVDIVKRMLRWNANKYIVSDKNLNANMKIDYLQPHARNVPVMEDRNYMAFTLYKRNGKQEVSNTGVFHFINSSLAEQNRRRCIRNTMHEGAYYYFYGKRPQDDSNIVASGYCYQGTSRRGLVYNSLTFNNAQMTYVDGQYYLRGNDRVVNAIEQSLIKSCYNSWKNSGFQVSSWKWSTAGIPVSPQPINTRSKRSDGVCDTCDCSNTSGSQSFQRYLQPNVFFLLITCLTSLSK